MSSGVSAAGQPQDRAGHDSNCHHAASSNLVNPTYSSRMATLIVDAGGRDDGGMDVQDNSLRNVAKRATDIALPGLGGSNTRSLFIFSEENFIRKYAKLIIEWGYPFLNTKSCEYVPFCKVELHIIYISQLLTIEYCSIVYSVLFRLYWTASSQSTV